jgi:hypothetical protein
MLDRSFFRWVCIIAALLLALIWLLSVASTGFSVPSWVPPSGLLALALAVAIP